MPNLNPIIAEVNLLCDMALLAWDEAHIPVKEEDKKDIEIAKRIYTNKMRNLISFITTHANISKIINFAPDKNKEHIEKIDKSEILHHSQKSVNFLESVSQYFKETEYVDWAKELTKDLISFGAKERELRNHIEHYELRLIAAASLNLEVLGSVKIKGSSNLNMNSEHFIMRFYNPVTNIFKFANMKFDIGYLKEDIDKLKSRVDPFYIKQK